MTPRHPATAAAPGQRRSLEVSSNKRPVSRKRLREIHRGALAMLVVAMDERHDYEEPAREFQVRPTDAVFEFAWRKIRRLEEQVAELRESRIGRAA